MADNNPGAPVVTFNHNLGTPEQVRKVMSLYINIIAASDKINDKPALADNIKFWLQGPSGSRYSPGQVDANVKEANRVYREIYDLSENGKYVVGIPNPIDIKRFSLIINKEKIGQDISDAIDGPDPTDFYQLLTYSQGANLGELAKDVITPQGGDPDKAQEAASGDPVKKEQEKIEEKQEELKDLSEAAKEGSAFLKNLALPYYVNDDYNTELGIIGNIYINIKMLYDLVTDVNLEAQDKKEKNEISLYDFIKNVMSRIQESIGNVNTFDVIADEKNNAKIIDINYVDKNAFENSQTVYDKAFPLQVHNLNSTVRSYKLESKIFQEQSSIIAIGAQVEGGALGIDTTTFVAFNRSIRDRIIPVKSAPSDSIVAANAAQEKVEALTSNLKLLFEFFGRLKANLVADPDFDVDKAGNYQNALKDLIAQFKSIVASKTNNKAILPTVLSVEMDGIGGLVIGTIFKTNTDILPKGYKGSGQGGIGPNVGYIITKLGHSVENGDWVTKIDAQTIILDPPKSEVSSFDYSNITININATTEKEVVENKKKSSNSTPTYEPGPKDGKVLNYNKNNSGKQTPNSIVLHCTAGYGSALSTVNFVNQKLSIHYAVDREGSVVQGMDENLIGWHANNKNPGSIGIEIGNIFSGYFNDKGILITDATKAPLAKGTGTIMVDIGFKWNGRQYFEDYSDVQIVALEKLIRGILQRNPKIKLNYTKNLDSIYKNVFGFSEKPQPGKSYSPVKPNNGKGATKDDAGIFTHVICAGSGHGDPPPTAKIINMLQRIAPQ